MHHRSLLTLLLCTAAYASASERPCLDVTESYSVKRPHSAPPPQLSAELELPSAAEPARLPGPSLNDVPNHRYTDLAKTLDYIQLFNLARDIGNQEPDVFHSFTPRAAIHATVAFDNMYDKESFYKLMIPHLKPPSLYSLAASVYFVDGAAAAETVFNGYDISPVMQIIDGFNIQNAEAFAGFYLAMRILVRDYLIDITFASHLSATSAIAFSVYGGSRLKYQFHRSPAFTDIGSISLTEQKLNISVPLRYGMNDWSEVWHFLKSFTNYALREALLNNNLSIDLLLRAAEVLCDNGFGPEASEILNLNMVISPFTRDRTREQQLKDAVGPTIEKIVLSPTTNLVKYAPVYMTLLYSFASYATVKAIMEHFLSNGMYFEATLVIDATKSNLQFIDNGQPLREVFAHHGNEIVKAYNAYRTERHGSLSLDVIDHLFPPDSFIKILVKHSPADVVRKFASYALTNGIDDLSMCCRLFGIWGFNHITDIDMIAVAGLPKLIVIAMNRMKRYDSSQSLALLLKAYVESGRNARHDLCQFLQKQKWEMAYYFYMSWPLKEEDVCACAFEENSELVNRAQNESFSSVYKFFLENAKSPELGVGA